MDTPHILPRAGFIPPLPVDSYSNLIRIRPFRIGFRADPAGVVFGVWLIVLIVAAAINKYPENVQKLPWSLLGHICPTQSGAAMGGVNIITAVIMEYSYSIGVAAA